MTKLTFAVCTYNRSERLRNLLRAMRRQDCPVSYEVLVVDNNSTDQTRDVVEEIARESDGAPVRYVFECEQGIPHARNRAIHESLGSDFLVFIDDDEWPKPGLLSAAVDALEREQAECVGGRVKVIFEPGTRPRWLSDDLLGFLAEIDHGPTAFWIRGRSTPVWTANVGYRVAVFRQDETLRFDYRYNRRGHQVGGGSDAVMFWNLLERGLRIRYRPDMAVDHRVERWRLKRRYFIKLHFVAGRKHGQYQSPIYPRTLFGIPPFMLGQAVKQWGRATLMTVGRRAGALRQAMNAAHVTGSIWGNFRRWRDGAAQE